MIPVTVQVCVQLGAKMKGYLFLAVKCDINMLSQGRADTLNLGDVFNARARQALQAAKMFE